MNNEQVKLAITNLSDEVKKIVRRQDDIQKSVDLLFADREILEDMQGSIKHLQEIIIQNQQHQDNTKKDLKADVKESQLSVEAKVDEVQKTMNEKTVIVKTEKENIFSKILKKLGGEEK